MANLTPVFSERGHIAIPPNRQSCKRRGRGQGLNLAVSTSGFDSYNSSKRFAVSLGMEMGQHAD
jgi:hypothetical protein